MKERYVVLCDSTNVTFDKLKMYMMKKILCISSEAS